MAGGSIPTGLDAALEVLEPVLDPIGKHVGHGNQLDRPLVDHQGIGHGAGTACSTADQSQPDRVVLGGVDFRDADARQRRSRDDRAGLLQKIAT